GIVQPRLEAEILLAHALDVDRLHLYLSPDKPLSPDERSRFRTFVQKRHAGVPLQHLIGEISFFGLRFRVHRDALIPRGETEELLDRALRLVGRDRPARYLDLGTGSGVLAVCLARYLPLASVTAVDVSPAALDLARENAARNGVADRIAFVQSDWFSGVEGSFDVVVSNPPYVESAAIDRLATEVRDHEPREALDGGPDGLDAIRRLTSGAGAHVSSGGRILLEIGHGQAQRVRDLLQTSGFDEVCVEADMSGRERFVSARRKS
ncbi:MAG: peptide chain release factor N(5)-glutamine methyltransferase, partial [Candidatus Bipolaricaulota bacterium]